MDELVIFEKHLYDLRNILADLYPDEASARRVAVEAGLPAVFIDWSGSAHEFWSQIVKQAEIRGGLRRLIDVAVGEYGEGKNSKELLKIRGDIGWYHTSTPSQESPPRVMTISTAKSDSERLATVETRTEYLTYGMGGLYLLTLLIVVLILIRT